MAVVNKRSGYIYHTEGMMDIFVIKADVPLAKMFGFATDLRGLTMGQVIFLLLLVVK
jgi:elongation factor G